MKGDLYIDFAVAVTLFVFAFISVFYFLDYEFNLKIQLEQEQSANLKIQNIFDSLPREKTEKRIIIGAGSSTNEFVNLAGYDIDLILNEKGNVVCFSPELNGFVANISNTKFYLYSAKANIKKETCEIQNFNNRILEKISTPVYEEFFVEKPKVNSSGKFCLVKPILIFSGSGLKEEKIEICI